MHKRNIQKLTILQEFEDGISFCSLWVGEGAILRRIYKQSCKFLFLRHEYPRPDDCK